MTKVAKAVTALKNLLALQVLLKAITFAFNIVIARSADPGDYGVANVDLTLVSIAIMFVSKENIRRAAQRAKRLESAETLVSPMQMWIGTGLDFLVAIVAFLFMANSRLAGPALVMCVAGVLEALGEPFYAKGMLSLDTKPRLKAEALGTISKCLVTYLTLDLGLVAFALGHLAQASSILLCYVSNRRGLPAFQLPIEPEVVAASLEMSGTVVLKFLLSEWEKIVLMFLYAAQESVFALVSNLGSIVCRILFSPIEVVHRQEVTHNLFTKDIKATEVQKLLPVLMTVMWSIGLLIAFYGQVFSDIAIAWLFGPKWAALVPSTQQAGEILAWYAVYILVMAVNGVSDAVVTAKSTPEDLRRKNYWMLGFSL